MNKIITNDQHLISFVEKEIDNKDKVLIMCHGITVNKDENGLFNEFEKEFSDKGWNTLRFDFRGHGNSPIKDIDCTITGMIQDLYYVLKYANEKYKTISLLSVSFGCSISLLYFQQFNKIKIDKVTFINPVISFETTFTKTNLPWGKSFFPQDGIESAIKASPILIGRRKFKTSSKMVTELYYYKPSKVVWNSKIPLLLHHGVNDTMVSYDTCVNFYEQNINNNVFMKTYQASHGITEARDELFVNLKEFLK